MSQRSITLTSILLVANDLLHVDVSPLAAIVGLDANQCEVLHGQREFRDSARFRLGHLIHLQDRRQRNERLRNDGVVSGPVKEDNVGVG